MLKGMLAFMVMKEEEEDDYENSTIACVGE